MRSDVSRRIRVLMLVDRLRYAGGAETLVVGLATYLPRDRYDVTVCTTRESAGLLLRMLDDAGIRHFSLERKVRFDLVAFRRLARFLRQQEIDVLHAHKFGSNAWGALIGRIARVPVVVAHEHSWSYRGQRIRRLVDGRLIGRFASAFVGGTQADRDRMVSVEGVPASKAIYMPGAYIPRPWAIEGDLRVELGVSAETPVIGTIAVLRPEKRLDVLIGAFADVAQSIPEARLAIAGAGPCRPQLERQAASLGLLDRIHFLGMRYDIDVVLEGFDVAAISSEREGTSLFSLECMAHKTPLVSTNVGGLSEILEDGVSALLVPPHDASALAKALETLLGDPSRRQSLAAAAHEKIDEFRIERIAARFGELYERLLEKRREAL